MLKRKTRISRRSSGKWSRVLESGMKSFPLHYWDIAQPCAHQLGPPYLLVYGTEAVIPAEVETPSLRIIVEAEIEDDECVNTRLEQLTMIDEKQMAAVYHRLSIDSIRRPIGGHQKSAKPHFTGQFSSEIAISFKIRLAISIATYNIGLYEKWTVNASIAIPLARRKFMK
nr:uncharacterized protein LOC104115930 [Nicotiana tomentosiformis]